MRIIFGNGKKWFSIIADNLVHAKVVMHEFLNVNGIEPIIIDSIDGAKVDEIFYPSAEGDLNNLVGSNYFSYINDHKLEINSIAITRTPCDPIFCQPIDDNNDIQGPEE